MEASRYRKKLKRRASAEDYWEDLALKILKGHRKTGHTGSLQKRPWEGSRNLDVVPFRSLFGQV